MNNTRQWGAALISALFITAIAAMLATAMAVQQRWMIARTQWVLGADQGYLDLQGVQDWAQVALAQWVLQQNLGKAAPTAFPQHFPSKHFHGMQLSAKVIDQQGLFNLNSLVQTGNQAQFIRLLQAVVPAMNVNQAHQIASAITQWLSPAGSADVYLNRKPAYRAGHQVFANKTELRAVYGISAAIYTALAPYVTALPAGSGVIAAININSAPIPVLMSLVAHIPVAKAQALWQCRQSHGWFQNVADYTKLCVVPLGLGQLKHITTKTHLFVLQAVAAAGQQQVVLKSFLMVQKNKQGVMTSTLVWQALN